ncbi:hypothetical protein JCM15519_30380 [Fundidesulfovibrio butyratiphilus]
MFSVLEGSKNNILAVEISGGYTKNDVDELKKIFEAVLAKGQTKVNFLVKIDRMSIRESEFGAFVEDARYALSHIKEIGLIAVVGKSDVQKFLTKVDNLVFGSPEKGRIEKYFDVADLQSAWDFVKGQAD